MEIEQSKPLALIIDDEESIRTTLSGVLSDEGWQTVTAPSGRDGIEMFKTHPCQLVMLDVWMKGMDGIETLQELKSINKTVPIVIMSGHASIETAVKATRLGAYEFLEKPLSIEKIVPLLEHAQEIHESLIHASEKPGVTNLVGGSEAIKKIARQIEVIGPRNSWVLITGRNGAGKEVVARNIHSLSPRSKNSFVAVNCAAIPEDLIESELFGHTKGAFTSAVADKQGKFQLADKGTLFLDEIGDMSLRTQAKILRILQEQTFEKLGGSESISVNVRVIAATNKELEEEIKLGNFREDLFYRLNVIPIEVPSLSERREDVPLLVDHFLTQNSEALDEEPKEVAPDAMEVLKNHPWPGNVRELKNLIERLCIMVPGREIQVNDLPDALCQVEVPFVEEIPEGISLKDAKRAFEKKFIMTHLKECGWNVSKTAEAIGIERSNLHKKIRAYGIDPKTLKG